MYDIYILKRAQKELSQIPAADYKQICNDINALGKNPRPSGSRKLTGQNGWRIRVGNYRVIYEIDDRKKILLFFI